MTRHPQYRVRTNAGWLGGLVIPYNEDAPAQLAACFDDRALALSLASRRPGAVVVEPGDVITELDVVADVADDDACRNAAALDDYFGEVGEAFDVAIRTVTTDGPGGGNPVVRVAGPRTNVVALARDWGYDLDAIVLEEVR